MPCAAHLHAPQAQLHVRRAFLEVAEVQDSVREELLLERRELAMVPGRDLGDQEARRVEGLQEPEEVEELAARVVQAAQAVQGREAVDGDEDEGTAGDAAAERFVEALDVGLHAVHGRTSNEPDGAIKGWWGDYQRWKQPARWDAPFSIEGPPSRGFRSLKPGKSESGCSASFGAGLPICSARTYAGRDGPRGDPAGLMVLPPRVRREPDGRRVRRRDANGLRPNPPGRRSALRRWEDLWRPRGWHRVRGVPGFAPDSANQPLRTEFHVVVRIIRGGTRGLRGPRHRRAPGGPNRGVPQTADAQAPRCKSPRPRPVRFRRRRADAQPRDSRVVDPAFFLRRRAARAPCHHPYHARPASGGECHRIPDRPEARALVSSTGRASSPR